MRISRTIIFILLLLNVLNIYPDRASIKRIKKLRKQYPSSTCLEKTVAFPGKLLFLPLKSVLKATRYGIIFADETRLVLKTLDIMTSDDETTGIRPAYSSIRGAGFKLYKTQILNQSATINLNVSIGLFARQHYSIEINNFKFPIIPLRHNFFSSFELLSTESFYGIGAKSNEKSRTNYCREISSFKYSLTLFKTAHSIIQTSISYEKNIISEGKSPYHKSIYQTYSENQLYGLANQLDYLTCSSNLKIDTRNDLDRPLTGQLLSISSKYYTPQKADQDFQKYWFDFRLFYHIHYYRRIMFRVAGEFTQYSSNPVVPFYYLSELGRSESIRGFERGRFRDQNALMASIEYLFPVSFFFDSYIFVDAGKVFHHDSLNEKQIQITTGLGMKLIYNQKVLGSGAIGFSSDGIRLHATVNSDF